MGVTVVRNSNPDEFVLYQKWLELDREGLEASGRDPFKALRDKGYSYGHAANPGTGGYVYRAWVRPPGVSQPLVATSENLVVAVLTLLCRALIRFERSLN